MQQDDWKVLVFFEQLKTWHAADAVTFKGTDLRDKPLFSLPSDLSTPVEATLHTFASSESRHRHVSIAPPGASWALTVLAGGKSWKLRSSRTQWLAHQVSQFSSTKVVRSTEELPCAIRHLLQRISSLPEVQTGFHVLFSQDWSLFQDALGKVQAWSHDLSTKATRQMAVRLRNAPHRLFPLTPSLGQFLGLPKVQEKTGIKGLFLPLTEEGQGLLVVGEENFGAQEKKKVLEFVARFNQEHLFYQNLRQTFSLWQSIVTGNNSPRQGVERVLTLMKETEMAPLALAWKALMPVKAEVWQWHWPEPCPVNPDIKRRVSLLNWDGEIPELPEKSWFPLRLQNSAISLVILLPRGQEGESWWETRKQLWEQEVHGFLSALLYEQERERNFLELSQHHEQMIEAYHGLSQLVADQQRRLEQSLKQHQWQRLSWQVLMRHSGIRDEHKIIESFCRVFAQFFSSSSLVLVVNRMGQFQGVVFRLDDGFETLDFAELDSGIYHDILFDGRHAWWDGEGTRPFLLPSGHPRMSNGFFIPIRDEKGLEGVLCVANMEPAMAKMLNLDLILSVEGFVSWHAPTLLSWLERGEIF